MEEVVPVRSDPDDRHRGLEQDGRQRCGRKMQQDTIRLPTLREATREIVPGVVRLKDHVAARIRKETSSLLAERLEVVKQAGRNRADEDARGHGLMNPSTRMLHRDGVS